VNILFCDVDGCLNSVAFWERRAAANEPGKAPRAEWEANRAIDPRRYVDPDAVERLNTLLDRSGARVVVSSTWRLPSLGENRAMLHRMGLRRARTRVVGWTPKLERWNGSLYLGATRGQEIAAWLETYGAAHAVERYVILDDDDDMGELLPRLVQTDHAVGLTDADVERALVLLNGTTSGASRPDP
jgi:hypothetical protein